MIDIPVSPNFKKMVVKSILAIVLFILIYLFLISAAVGIFLGSVYFCLFFLLKWDVNITASILLSLGILSFAGLLLYFLIKFIFVKDKIDRSHMVEISRNDEPELYKLIEEVVEEVEEQLEDENVAALESSEVSDDIENRVTDGTTSACEANSELDLLENAEDSFVPSTLKEKERARGGTLPKPVPTAPIMKNWSI
jgi:hypothetical protein